MKIGAENRCENKTMSQVIIIHSEKTWPAELIRYLEDHQDLFVSWELRGTDAETRKVSPREYDSAIYGLRDVLRPYHLHGYHCTRLTDDEIDRIKKEGMSLQNRTTLCARIDSLIGEGIISESVGTRLKSENQADDDNRAHMLWFCFFEPHLAGEGGIERFFRSWGGEALYNSHEGDLETGEAIGNIGTPCLIESQVPIASLNEHSFLDTKIIRNYLKNRDYDIRECMNHEGYARTKIDRKDIKQVIQFPSDRFVALTKCHEWKTPL